MLIHGDNLIWFDEGRKALYKIKLIKNDVDTQGQAKPLTSAAELMWLPKDAQKPSAIAADESYIYIADSNAAAILRLAADGSVTNFIAGEPLQSPSGLAIVGRTLYVSDASARKVFGFDLTTGRLIAESIIKSGAMPTKIRSLGGELVGVDFSGRTLFRFTLSNSQLKTELPTAVASIGQLASSFIYRQELDLTSSIANLTDFDVSNNVVYCLDSQKRTLYMLPLEGAAPVFFKYSNYTQAPTAIALDDKYIYIADDATGSFLQLPLLIPATIFFEGKDAQESFVSYLILLNSMNFLPTREYALRDEESFDRIAAEQGLLSQSSRSQYVQLLCRLNQNICQKPRVEGEVVNLPAINVRRYYASLPISLPSAFDPNETTQNPDPKRTVETVTRKLIGSDLTRLELDKRLTEMNRAYEGPDILSATKGYFLVPSPAFAVNDAVPLRVLNERAIKQTDPLWRDTIVSLPYSTKPQSLTDMQTQNVVPHDGESACNTLAADFCKVLKVVKYYLPSEVAQFEVGVVDLSFDPRHPAFKITADESALSVYNAPGRPPAKPSGEDSAATRNEFDVRIDHGNHVSGLIGARSIKNEMQGLNPAVRIYGVTLGDFYTALEEDENSELRNLNLFNLSIGEDPNAPERNVQFDALKVFMLKHSECLFVIAAGDRPTRIPPEVIASKGYLDNVIVVGATDTSDEPNFLQGTSYDELLVSVVAPGKNVRSVLAGSSLNFGATSGTSQAAPLVTGTAAILMSLQNGWEPWQVKHRIVATSDLTNWADGNQSDKVLAGLLDVKRAILDRNNVVVIEKKQTSTEDGELIETKGRLQQNYLDKVIIIKTGNPNEPQISIPYKYLLRVKRSKSDRNKYVIIYAYEDPIPGVNVTRINRRLRRLVVNGSQIQGVREFRLLINPRNSDDPGSKAIYDIGELEDFINTYR